MNLSELTDKERAFLAAWNGNATQAAIDAGLVPASKRNRAGVLGHQYKNKLSRYITQATAENAARVGVDADQLRDWWASRMQDADEKIEIRVKCSELLGKALGVFIERRELTGTLTVAGLQAELEARRHG